MTTQKEEEIEILTKFINLYNKDLEILDLETAKSVLPIYSGENPDFLIKNKDSIVGIEVTELLPKQQKYILLDKEEEKLNIKNNAHHKQKLPSYSLLYEVPELTPVALERINDKIRKSNNYVTKKTWLLAYGTHPDSLCMLKPTVDDNEVDIVVNSLFDNIQNWNNLSKVFLYEDSGTSYIIEMNIPDKTYLLYKFRY